MPLLQRHSRRIERFDWKRYWLPRGEPVVGDGGFVAEPRSFRFLVPVNNHLKTLDELDEVRCLLLLGDPGLGKSYDIGEYVARLTARLQTAQAPTFEIIACDISEFDDREQIRRTIFESAAIQAWKQSNSLLYLVLDSLDESLIPLGPLCTFLLDQLEGLPLGRCRLRIACRTSEMPGEFRSHLEQRFRETSEDLSDAASSDERAASGLVTRLESPSEHQEVGEIEDDEPDQAQTQIGERSFATVELAALTRAAARAAAAVRLASEQGADAFITSVEEADVSVFAARPLTLLELVEQHRRGESLSTSQAGLYESMCQRLADHRPGNSGTTRATLRTTPRQRYLLARRISALMILGNRRTLWLGEGPRLDRNALQLGDIAGDEMLGSERVSASETELREAINTGLFTAVGETGLQAHTTLAEFMSAAWVIAHNLPLVQVLSLISDAADPERHVIPQLRQVGAWLAAGRNEVFEHISATDPDLLLWNDVVHLPIERRSLLVDALLRAVDENRLPNPPLFQHRPLSRLAHPGLSDQLLRIVAESARHPRVRHMALDIADACRLTPIATAAADIALNPREPLDLRTTAASLVAEAGTDSDRFRLVSLATQPMSDDPQDQLKGAALLACWPNLQPSDLFRSLTRIKVPNFGGRYGTALHRIASDLPGTHLAAAAEWLARTLPGGIYFDDVVRRVFTLAFHAADPQPDARVIRDLGTFIRRQLAEHENVFGGTPWGLYRDSPDPLSEAIRTRPDLRRSVVTAVLNSPGEPSDLHSLGELAPGLLTRDDAAWAIAELAHLSHEDMCRANWVAAIQEVVNLSDTEHIRAALDHRGDPDVVNATHRLITQHETVEGVLASIGGLQARHRERSEESSRRFAQQRTEREARIAADRADQGVPLGALVSRVVDALELRGDLLQRWFRIAGQLLQSDDGMFKWSFDSPRLEALRELSRTPQRGAVVAAAAEYLRDAEIQSDPFPGDRIRTEVFLGSAAFVTIQVLDCDLFDQIAPETLLRWTAIIARHFGYGAEKPFHAAVLQRIIEAAPTDASAVLLEAVSASAAAERWISDELIRLAAQLREFRTGILRAIAADRYSLNQTEYLLREILKADAAQTLPVALQLFARRRRGQGERSKGLVAGSVLLHEAPALAWRQLWRRLRGDAAARELLSHAAATRDVIDNQAIAQLSDQQVADLYLRVAELYPQETDPWHVGVYSPGARDNLGHWRSQLLNVLQSRRRDSAVAQLERIARSRPEDDWLTRVWLGAQAALRNDRWHGTAPRELLQLAERADLRLVESGADLLSLLRESVDRFQDDLQGELRSVTGLWNEGSRRNSPKGEEHLTNAIARHLRQDLQGRRIVVGRELILQIGVSGGAPGRRTDIDVVAVAREGAERISRDIRAIIEVKGSWNPSVRASMKTQLVNGYLDPQRIPVGLFIVGQYACSAWRPEARKTRSASLGAVRILQGVLDAQAASLTNAVRLVAAVVLDTSLPGRPRQTTR